MTDTNKSVAAEMRAAADLLEKVCRLYGYSTPERGEWSALQLRNEANIIDRPGGGLPA